MSESGKVEQWMRDAAAEGYEAINDWLTKLLRFGPPVPSASELKTKLAEIIASHAPTPAPPPSEQEIELRKSLESARRDIARRDALIVTQAKRIESMRAEAPSLPPADPQAPLHPFEVYIHVGGETWDYVLRQLRDLLDDARRREPGTLQGFGGGGGGSYSITTALRDISPEDFRKELLAWRDTLPTPRGAGEKGAEQ